MSKPKLDTSHVQSELSQSAFFRKESESQQVDKPGNHEVKKSTSLQVDRSTSQQFSESTNQQVAKPESQQENTSTKRQVSTLTLAQMDRFTTYLRPATIKALKLLALESDKDMYEVVQEALERYLQEQGRGSCPFEGSGLFWARQKKTADPTLSEPSQPPSL